jgi:hypothetical protein
VKYLQAFLAGTDSSDTIREIEPAKAAKARSAGFAGSLPRNVSLRKAATSPGAQTGSQFSEQITVSLTDEVAVILSAWGRIVGVKLDPETVQRQLTSIRSWQKLAPRNENLR